MKKMRLPRLAVLLLVTATTPTGASAQDSHYWALQNGARATILGGTVVALEPDLSASFYNPGALARGNQDDALSMFASISTHFEVDMELAQPLTATSDVGNSAPGFFALRIPGASIVEGDVVTFSYVVRHSSQLDMGGVGAGQPAVPTAAADLFVFQDIYDGWYGLSWARDVESVGIGVSVFYSSVSYRQRVQTREVLLPGMMEGTVLGDDLHYSFSARRLIAKGGVTWTGGPLSLGATVTLPSLRLPFSVGRASVGHTVLSRDPAVAAELSQDSQKDLSAQYKNPFSVAVGAEADLAGFDFHLSAEWFAGVDPYDVLETAPFTSQVPGRETDLPIMQSRESVLNLGAGLEWEAAPFLSFFGSARTDNSFRDSTQPSFVGLDHFDLVHLTGGIGVMTDALDVWFGGMYGWGDAEERLAPSPLPTAPENGASTSFEQIGFILAFSAAF